MVMQIIRIEINPFQAMHIYFEMRSLQNLKPRDLTIHTSLLRILQPQKDALWTREILHDIFLAGLTPDMATICRCIELQAAWTDINGVLQMVRDNDITLTVEVYNTCFAFMKKVGQTFTVKPLYEEMIGDNVAPNVETVVNILECFAARKEVTNCREFWKRMKDVKIAPTPSAYHGIMRGLAGDPTEALLLLEEMKQRWNPNVHTYSIIIYDYATVGDYAAVKYLMDEMKERKIEPLDNTIRAQLMAIRKIHHEEEMEKVRKEMVQRGFKDPPSYGFILAMYGEMGKVEKMEQCWQELIERGVPPVNHLINIMREFHPSADEFMKKFNVREKEENV